MSLYILDECMQHALCVTDRDTLSKFMIIELFLHQTTYILFLIKIISWMMAWNCTIGFMILFVHLMTVN